MHLDVVRRVRMPQGRDLGARPQHHFAVNLLPYYATAIVLLVSSGSLPGDSLAATFSGRYTGSHCLLQLLLMVHRSCNGCWLAATGGRVHSTEGTFHLDHAGRVLTCRLERLVVENLAAYFECLRASRRAKVLRGAAVRAAAEVRL